MAIRDSVAKWRRAISARAMGLVAVGIVIGMVVGIGVGYKIEQSRTQSDVSRLKAQIKQSKHAKSETKHAISGTKHANSGTTRVSAKRSAPFDQRLGTVTAVDAGTITVATKHAGVVELHTTSATQFERAVSGTKTKITVGRRALLALGGDVLVFARGSLLGQPITSVRGDSFSITKASGTGTATILFSRVKAIDTTSTAPRSDVKTGAVVLAGGHAGGKGAFNAAKVVVLPPASGLAG